MHLSKERTIFICYQFFKQIRSKYEKKPIYTDGAQWYIDACKWLRLKHIVYGTELEYYGKIHLADQRQNRLLR